MLKKNNNKSNKLSHPPPSLIIIKIHSRLPREGGGTGEKGKREKKGLSRGSVGGSAKKQDKQSRKSPLYVSEKKRQL